jgi:uncharacterized membrane protein
MMSKSPTAQDAGDRLHPTGARWPLWLIALCSVLVGLASYRYLAPGAPGGAPPILANSFTRFGVLTIHAAAASTALIIGPFQFMPRQRARRPGLHRWMGRLYVLACLIGGLSGAVLALGARTGVVSTVGFGLLAVSWLYVTGRAFDAARSRRIAEHRRFMVRSFALTFAAVTLRIYLPFAFASPLGYDNTYRAISFLCWVPNLIAAETWIYWRMRPPTQAATS